MQFKTLLVALGFAAAAIAAPAPIEARAPSASFKIRRFTPGPGFTEVNTPANSWGNNQYVGIQASNHILTYKDVTTPAQWTYDPVGSVLRGSGSGVDGLPPRNQQSYETTVTPIFFGGVGDLVKVTIGPAPLFEVKFQTQRGADGAATPVAGWTSLAQLGGHVYLGKAADVSAPVRFRAEGYVPAPQ